MKITSVNNELIKFATSLSQKKERDTYKQCLIAGEHLMAEARKQNLIIQTLGIGPGYDIEISEHVAKKLSTTQSGSSSFALIRQPEWTLPQGQRFLLCDGLQDPGNLGTIIRTAYSFGFDAVVVSEDSVDIYNDKVIRGSQGALFHLPVLRLDLHEVIRTLQKQGVRVYATALHTQAKSLETLTDDKLAVVLGSEGAGVSEAILNICDDNLSISTKNFESLNVAIAAGIICYSVQKG